MTLGVNLITAGGPLDVVAGGGSNSGSGTGSVLLVVVVIVVVVVVVVGKGGGGPCMPVIEVKCEGCNTVGIATIYPSLPSSSS